jgi:hypothetical protein
MSKLKEKPSALKREHPALPDTDPDPQHWLRGILVRRKKS